MFVGIDGARIRNVVGPGWVAVLVGQAGVVRVLACGNLADLLSDPDVRDADRVAIDMPVGLPEIAITGGRECERMVRQFLVGVRKSSVFSSPSWRSLDGTTRKHADMINRANGDMGVTAQAFGLFPRLREVDQLISADSQGWIVETHPEAGFALLACEHGVANPLAGKNSRQGLEQRRKLIDKEMSVTELDRLARQAPKVNDDDLLDAAVAAWTAKRHFLGAARAFPPVAGAPDRRGRLMQIWA
jgi:predicted RNase H-like nuclease